MHAEPSDQARAYRPVGTNTITARAWDAAGNEGVGETTFVTVVTYTSMKALTSDWVAKAGVRTQLLGYLDNAAKAEARGNLKAEAANLDSYRSLLLAQAGKAIDPYYEDLLWSRSWLL